MSEERKKPVWPCIAASLVGLPVLYAASLGPACWWLSEPNIDPDFDPNIGGTIDVHRYAPSAYWPFGALAAHGPQAVRRFVWMYATASGKYSIALPCDLQSSRWTYPR